MDEAATIEWARTEASRLRALSNPKLHASASQAREFLRTHAPRSAFYEAAIVPGRNASGATSEVHRCAGALEEWATFVESGFASAVPYEQRFRTDAASDLMEQVQQMLDDSKTHPAVPVMVAGAALEEHLRGLLAATGETVSGSPSIVKYAETLKKIDQLNKHDVHQLTSMASTRNVAAHGNFDEISKDAARLFVDRVNFFLSQTS